MISTILTLIPLIGTIQRPPAPVEKTSCPSSVTIPMLPGANRAPIIEIKIAGKPYRFALDTGTVGGGRISPAILVKLGLKPIGKVLAGDPSGKGSREVSLYKIPELTAGSAHFYGVPMFADAGPAGTPEYVDGVLGFGVFKDLLLTFDYPARQITFKRGSLPSSALTYGLDHGVPTLPIEIGKVKIKGHIDSGSDGGIMVPMKFKNQLPLAGEPKVIGRARTNFNTIEIFGAKVKGPITVGGMAANVPMIEMHDMFPFGNIGAMFLQLFKVSIDQKNKRISFEKPKK